MYNLFKAYVGYLIQQRGKMASNQEESKKSGIVDNVMDYAVSTINRADPDAAKEQVAQLRKQHPNLSNDELADLLIKKKCYSAGAVGAVSSGMSVVPGIGTVLALTFGAAADISMTYKQQAELVLEIAAVYDHSLSSQERRKAVLLVTGIGAGAQHLATKGGQQIAKRATEKLAARTFAKAIPIIGVGISAGGNILATYVIGQRAKAYFNPQSESQTELLAMSKSFDSVSNMDLTTISTWLSETTESSYQLVADTTQEMLGGMIVAGQKSGELVLIGAGQGSEGITALVGTLSEAAASIQQFAVSSGAKVGQAVSATGQSVAKAGKATGEMISKTGENMAEIGSDAVEGMSSVAGKAAETIGELSELMSWSKGENETDSEESEETDSSNQA